MDGTEILVLLGLAGASAAMFVFLTWSIYAHFLVVAPPNRALVIFGRSSSRRRERDALGHSARVGAARFIVGGAAFVFPWTHSCSSLPLGAFDVDVPVRGVRTADGGSPGRLDLRVGVQAKITSDPEGLVSAAENLLGKSEAELRSLVRSLVEGHVPSVLARVPYDQVEGERERVATEIQVLVATDLVALGMVVSSLSLKEIAPSGPGFGLPAPEASRTGSSAGSELDRSVREMVGRLRMIEHRLEELDRRTRTPEILPIVPELTAAAPRVTVLRGPA